MPALPSWKRVRTKWIWICWAGRVWDPVSSLSTQNPDLPSNKEDLGHQPIAKSLIWTENLHYQENDRGPCIDRNTFRLFPTTSICLLGDHLYIYIYTLYYILYLYICKYVYKYIYAHGSTSVRLMWAPIKIIICSIQGKAKDCAVDFKETIPNQQADTAQHPGYLCECRHFFRCSQAKNTTRMARQLATPQKHLWCLMHPK